MVEGWQLRYCWSFAAKAHPYRLDWENERPYHFERGSGRSEVLHTSLRMDPALNLFNFELQMLREADIARYINAGIFRLTLVWRCVVALQINLARVKHGGEPPVIHACALCGVFKFPSQYC